MNAFYSLHTQNKKNSSVLKLGGDWRDLGVFSTCVILLSILKLLNISWCLFVQGGEDCVVRIWSLASGRLLHTVKNLSAPATCICWPASIRKENLFGPSYAFLSCSRQACLSMYCLGSIGTCSVLEGC